MDAPHDLGAQTEAFIADAVGGGHYGSRDELLREGVRLVQRREARRAKLDADLAQAIEQIEDGHTYDADTVFDRLQSKYKAMAEKDLTDQLADIRAAVAEGIADADAGRQVDAEQAFAELDTHFRALSHIRSA